MQPPGDSSCPSSTNAHTSSTIFPPLSRGIKRLLERRLAQPAHRVGELLRLRSTHLEILPDHPLQRRRDLFVPQARPLDLADGRLLVRPSAEQDLVEFLAFFIDAENADVADMV